MSPLHPVCPPIYSHTHVPTVAGSLPIAAERNKNCQRAPLGRRLENATPIKRMEYVLLENTPRIDGAAYLLLIARQRARLFLTPPCSRAALFLSKESGRSYARDMYQILYVRERKYLFSIHNLLPPRRYAPHSSALPRLSALEHGDATPRLLARRQVIRRPPGQTCHQVRSHAPLYRGYQAARGITAEQGERFRSGTSQHLMRTLCREQ